MANELIYKNAEGIRGLACISVVVLHALGHFHPDLAKYLSGTGQYGVWIFFVLSAFLLSNKFLNRDEFNVKIIFSYFIGRFFRIMPLFVFCVVIYFYLDVFNWEKALKIITFKDTYAHLWTIPVEFKFYLLIPVVVLLANIVKKYCNFFGLFVFFFFLLLSVFPAAGFLKYWQIIFSGAHLFHVFFFGVIIAFLIGDERFRVNSFKWDCLAFFILLLFFFISPLFLNKFFGLNTMGRSINNENYLIVPVFVAIFVYILLLSGGFWSVILNCKFLRLLGEWSYSIYLIHWVVIIKLAAHYRNSISMTILAIFEAIAVGALLYYIIENPIEKIRRKYIRF